MRFHFGRSVLGLAAAALALSPAAYLQAAEHFQRLTGSQIKARLAGMEFTDEVHSAYVFGRDGRTSFVTLGKRGTGTWQVENGRLCMTGSSGDRECNEVWMAGKRVQLRRQDGVLPEEGILQKPGRRL